MYAEIVRRAFACLSLVVFLAPSVADAQDPQTSQDPQQPTHDMSRMNMSTGWQFMQDGLVDGLFNHQGSPRGDNEGKAPSWWMGMFVRDDERHRVTLTGMFSLDEATVGKRGYREIFQTGEAVDNQPLIDHQHPHDFFMQLAAAWRLQVSEATAITLAGAPVGEPALGPIAFMHRPSAAAIAFAPLSHHIFDSTHVSFGVATIGVERGRWIVEASVFNGREPDENRWDFDFARPDSLSGRVWFNPTPAWSLQVSSGRLMQPEELEPGNVIRSTASVSWFQSSATGFSAATFGYGRNDDEGRQAVFGEYSTQDDRDTLSARLEILQVETELLLTGSIPDEGHDQPLSTLTSLSVGGLHELGRWRGVEGAVGANISFQLTPTALRPAYGAHPLSFQLFFRLRPKAGDMGRMWNMRMAQ